MDKLIQMLKNWFTARDNETYSLTKLFGIAAIVSLCYNFITVVSADFIGFAGGVAAIIAAMAAKYHAEGP